MSVVNHLAMGSVAILRPPAADAPRLIDRIPTIPRRARLHGPLTARRLRRFYLLMAVIFLAGLAPVVLDASPWLRAFGLGLMFPGAGFLYAGGIPGVALALVSFVAFLVVLFFWWARGILPAPPAVLVGSAALAALYTGGQPGIGWMEWVIPSAVVLFHAVLANNRRRDFLAARARGQSINEKIAATAPLLRDYPVTALPEMPAGQIRELRRMLDLALQPVESWDGFSMADPWQDGALRYQICGMSWNLAFGQYTSLPAFHGYLNQAQENLIRKHIHRNTWNYWLWESLWGNFRYQKNPISIDNIMLSGFLGTSLGLFETSSGTSPFAKPGELTFRWDDSTAFEYSHETLLHEVVKNAGRYDYGWFPCEPRWIYSMCNLVGRTGLALYDRRHGTSLEATIAERFDRTMAEEMTLADGRIRVCTSSLFGFQVPSLSGLFGETWGIRFLTHFAPGEAERLWQIMKQQFISVRPDGRLDFRLLPLGWDTRKPADFSKWPELNPLVMTLAAALEMGDDQIVAAARHEIDARYGDRVADSVSWTGTNTVRNMVLKGLPDAWVKGPVLSDAKYPDVIPARAVSDGQALHLVLHPGGKGGHVQLGFSRLVPGRTYRLRQSGVEMTADSTGSATLTIALHDRVEFDIVPAA